MKILSIGYKINNYNPYYRKTDPKNNAQVNFVGKTDLYSDRDRLEVDSYSELFGHDVKINELYVKDPKRGWGHFFPERTLEIDGTNRIGKILPRGIFLTLKGDNQIDYIESPPELHLIGKNNIKTINSPGYVTDSYMNANNVIDEIIGAHNVRLNGNNKINKIKTNFFEISSYSDVIKNIYVNTIETTRLSAYADENYTVTINNINVDMAKGKELQKQGYYAPGVKLSGYIKVGKIKFINDPGEVIVNDTDNCVSNITRYQVENGKLIYNLRHRKKPIEHNIDANDVNLSDFVVANYISADNVKLKDHSKAGFIQLKDKAILSDNSEVDDIQVNGKNKPEIILDGNAKVSGTIEFFYSKGKVYLKNRNIKLNPEQVINGEIIKDYPLKGFEKIAGMEDLKQQLRDDIIEPLANPEKHKKYGLGVINGFLMYGPPGCGKTFVVQQLAEETGRYFVEIKPSNVGSSYIHETARQIAQKFNEARAHKPALVFIDEIEALAPSRDGLDSGGASVDINEQVTELLQQLNNSSKEDILVVLASNEPQRIDNAIKRTGRMDKKIFVGHPDFETRKALFSTLLSKVEAKEDNIDLDRLAELSEYYTAEDIKMVLRQACVYALKRDLLVGTDMIINALKQVKPSLSEKLVNQYKIKGDMS